MHDEIDQPCLDVAQARYKLLTAPSDRNSLHVRRIELPLWSVASCVPRPLAPSEPDVTVHIVLNDFGPLGRA